MRDVALLGTRLVVGSYLAVHGAQKLFGTFGGPGLDKAGAGFHRIGLRPGYSPRHPRPRPTRPTPLARPNPPGSPARKPRLPDKGGHPKACLRGPLCPLNVCCL
jgi:hypothetical protein